MRVLRGEVLEARAIAEAATALPFLLTRDLAALAPMPCDASRAGAGAPASWHPPGRRRLRGEGLGVQLDDVADWFLRRWPDIRGSDALETFATEYDCQGLELDVAGLAWGGDLLWSRGRWHTRRFAGQAWQERSKDAHYVINKYRVLLTRARYETVIWVPRGSDAR